MEDPAKSDFVIIGYRDWCYAEDQGINVRDLHFAVGLADSRRVRKVLFINRPVTMVEQVLRLKRWKLRSGELVDRGFGYRLYRVSATSGLYVLCTWVPDLISPLILGRIWWNSAFMKRRVQGLIAKAKRVLGITDDVLMLCTPFGVSAIDSISHRHLIFDVIDNFSKHLRMRNIEKRFCMSAYRTIEKRADAITCVSAESAEVFPNARNVIVVRNGVERSWLALRPERPGDFRGLKGKIVGFGGNITKKFNSRFLADLAGRMPDVNFVLIGKVLDRGVLSEFKGIGNILYLGFRDFSKLPAYYYHFDAGMILYQSEKAHDGDPLKLYEYLSLGTPVVSLPAKWVQPRFGGVLFVSGTPTEFKSSLEYVLSRERESWRDICRKSISEADFWDTKVATIANCTGQGKPG